jgi:hypothetical protein
MGELRGTSPHKTLRGRARAPSLLVGKVPHWRGRGMRPGEFSFYGLVVAVIVILATLPRGLVTVAVFTAVAVLAAVIWLEG